MKVYDIKDPDQMILRDYLARDRTKLASERTFLAYIRTALGLFSAGAGCVKFINDVLPLYIIGCILLAVSPFVLAFGIVRFVKTRKFIAQIPDNKLYHKE